MMKKLFSLLFVAMTMVSLAHATTFTFNDTISQTKDGITVRFALGAGQSVPAYNGGLRLYAKNTITVSGGTITSISIEFTKQGKKDYAELSASVGSLVSGGVSTSNEDVKTDTWTGSASKVVFTLGASGQRVVKSITVVGTGAQGDEGGDDDGGEGGDGGDESGLNEEYVYSEPTVVENHDSVGNNMAYSFIQNNIKVDCTKGARTNSYFSCNAGSSITFTATENIKGLVIDGYVKKGFEATATAGSIDYVDATDEEVTADPVLVIADINSKSITIDCDKQMRCYSVEFYFDANPTATIGGGGSGDEGDYNFDFEPTEPTALTINIADSIILTDAVSDYGIIDAYMWNDDYEVELYFNVAQADPTSIIPLGVYVINDSEEAGTMTASPGGDDFYDYPSVIMGDWTYEEETEWTEEGWYYNKAYYIETGIADVTMSGDVVTISVEATTHFGSTVALTCTYKVETSTALEQVEAAVQPAKMMHRGQLMIRRGNHLFNAQGAALK